MRLESVKPAQGAFVALRYPFEYLVHVYLLVTAYPQQCAVNKAGTGAFAQQTLLDKYHKLHDHGFLQFRESVVRNRFRKQMLAFDTFLIQIKVFKAFMVGTVEHYYNGDNFCL